MLVRLSGEVIQQQLNALSISIDIDFTAKMTYSDIGSFSQWDIQYIWFNSQNRKEKKTFDKSN